MKITKSFSTYVQSYEIDLREEKLGSISINRRLKVCRTDWEPSVINCPGCGDMTIEQTNVFLGAIGRAGYLAECLDKEIEPKMLKDFIVEQK